ncbi:hypothetical protein PCANC_11071 [Puccinia coronata f. sp. avenae]|uniref:Uncharacterized protein n=1 Tax=Puccinia coronata f. sp. avenae TaxID=200324 RepID=A0A2N5UW39_9BASI|nr:hypothetical protein PCANC_11071 [Puccinia coronata f. sp. avenae]
MNPSQPPGLHEAQHQQMRIQQGEPPPPEVPSYTSLLPLPQSFGQASNQFLDFVSSYNNATSSSQHS